MVRFSSLQALRSFPVLRRVLMVPMVPLASLLLVSCAGMYGPPVPGPQPFPQPQPPRFGYGGVQSPNNVPPPVVTPGPRSNPSQGNSGGYSGGNAGAPPVRKKPPVVIKRDPNDTIVDLTPPEPAPTPPPAALEKIEPKPAPVPEVKPTVEPAPVVPERTPAPAPKPVAREDLPYGIPAVTKPGCVYSPYHTTGLVDVEGFARGKKVECPYTGKFFRVP